MRTVEKTANELVEKFDSFTSKTDFFGGDIHYRNKVKCAIIAVDITINKLLHSNIDEDDYIFCKQVKQELETRLNNSQK